MLLSGLLSTPLPPRTTPGLRRPALWARRLPARCSAALRPLRGWMSGTRRSSPRPRVMTIMPAVSRESADV